MIILHNPHDKISREFVASKKEDDIVIEYPDCIEQYPNVSGFPSVVIPYIPAKTVIIEDGDDSIEFTTDEQYNYILKVENWNDVNNFLETLK